MPPQLISDEQAIKKIISGGVLKIVKLNVKKCTGTPIAKYLQKIIFLQQTNLQILKYINR